MTKFAIISDIHGNLPALVSVLHEAMLERGILRQNIRFLGDALGYGPYVNEVTDIIRSMEIPTVMGNHDRACVEPEIGDAQVFNEIAQAPIPYTMRVLSDKNRDFLKTRGYSLSEEGFECFHASPVEPKMFYYIEGTSHSVSIDKCFKNFREQVLFVGHTHFVRMLKEDKNDIEGYQFTEIPYKPKRLEEGTRYIINAGSVGQPRNKDYKACYVIFDNKEKTIEFSKVDYDLKKMQKAVIESEYGRKKITLKNGSILVVGEVLAERLEKGM